ncbi:MAG: zinc ribbon domain-containing protein [Phycisphaerae bacterium]|nr:zinc ribbon domain-containing protein [Phycisphaerae bacterium]
MPTYDYLCASCNHKFEKFESMSANPSKKCPECGKMQLKRLIGSGAGVIFKGSGFYETDYRSENYKQGKKDETPAAPKAEEKPKDKEAKKEAKPKTESKTKTPKK